MKIYTFMPVYVSIYCALISPLVFTNPCSSMVWNCMQNMYATSMGANDKISFTLIRVLCKNHFRAWPSIKTIYVGNPPPQIIWTCNDHLEVISSGDIRWAIIKLICQWLRLFRTQTRINTPDSTSPWRLGRGSGMSLEIVLSSSPLAVKF